MNVRLFGRQANQRHVLEMPFVQGHQHVLVQTFQNSLAHHRSISAKCMKQAKHPDVELRTVPVDLGDRSYPIYIGADLLEDSSKYKPHIKGDQVLIVTNTTVGPIYLKRLKVMLESEGYQVFEVELPDGEQYKNLENIQKVWDVALENRLTRKCTFIALGGGVIGDMTGYAASCYLRGVDFIQIPTTLMAQVDSSVGGKTGVNHPLGKNMIGTFYQPKCVVIDISTLDTLPDRELASGVSEVIKYGLIWDGDLFRHLQWAVEGLRHRDRKAIAEAVEWSCKIKRDVVQLDEREGGLRATLNLGHTFGHAIETWQNYTGWLHGEAVGCGIVMAAHLSCNLGWIEPGLFEDIHKLIQRARLPTLPPQGMTPDDFMRLMQQDKKVEAGTINFILLKGEVGKCLITGDFEQSMLQRTLQEFCAQELQPVEAFEP